MRFGKGITPVRAGRAARREQQSPLELPVVADGPAVRDRSKSRRNFLGVVPAADLRGKSFQERKHPGDGLGRTIPRDVRQQSACQSAGKELRHGRADPRTARITAGNCFESLETPLAGVLWTATQRQGHLQSNLLGGIGSQPASLLPQPGLAFPRRFREA